MVKANRPGSHKAGSNHSQAGEKSQAVQPTGQQPSTMPSSSQGKGKQNPKSRQRTIGGTAVTGAKSTQPKELSTGTPANQLAEYYNREMRRRMKHMGTGPYSERATVDPRERRKKRLERLKERQERVRQLVDARGPSRDIKLGRRNTYFLIGIAVVVVLLVVVFLIIRHPF